MFTGFPEATEQFLIDLRLHNDGAWFNENKPRYLRDVQAPFYALIEELIPVMQEIDPLIEIRPHKILSRIRRDTRFSRDKSPYRDHLWLWFKRGGEERWKSLGFWFEFGPGRLGWGMATWDENRPMMDRFRRELVADPARIGGLLHGMGLPERHLQVTGDRFRRLEVPPSVPEALRGWYTLKDPSIMQTRFAPGEAAGRGLFGHLVSDYRAMAPLYRLLRGLTDTEADPAAAQAQPAEKPAPSRRRKPPDGAQNLPGKKYEDEW